VTIAMVKKVIVPIGLEQADEATLRCAEALASRVGGVLELISVSGQDDVDRAERHLAAVARNCPQSTTWRVIEGTDVEGELVGEALHQSDALLCLSSAARGSLAESMWGSISEDLARDAGLPVVLVGPHGNRRVERDDGVLLVPLDGTLLGEAILPDAVTLATDLALSIMLVQVIDPHDVPAGVTVEESNYLHNVARERNGSGIEINWEVLHGRNVGRTIADYVEREERVVLIAMATRGVPVAGRLYYPSATFSLLRHSAAPVTVLHPRPVSADEPVQEHQRVVVGLDDLDASRPALIYAAEEAVRRDLPLRVVHARSVSIWASAPFVPMPSRSIIEEAERAELARIDLAVDELQQRFPKLTIDTVIARGTAANLIIDSSGHAALVVVGRRHHSRLVEAIFGSTADSVAHNVACPVVSVPCPI
jgi:nucleotide-binding universal stress UspA family protein